MNKLLGLTLLIILCSHKVAISNSMSIYDPFKNSLDDQYESEDDFHKRNEGKLVCCTASSPTRNCCFYGFRCCNRYNRCHQSTRPECSLFDSIFGLGKWQQFNQHGEECGSFGYICVSESRFQIFLFLLAKTFYFDILYNFILENKLTLIEFKKFFQLIYFIMKCLIKFQKNLFF